jgi:two-component system, OmpR family, phosphate regulon sensor histidine kinase PhoR
MKPMSEFNWAGSTGVFAAALLETLPHPALIVDQNVRIVASNGAARKILPGLRLREPLILTLRAPDVLDGVARVLISKRAETTLLHERVPVERVFEVTINPLDVAGIVSSAVVIALTDMTEARRLEQMRVNFVANASHELRTPLASILGFVETLQGPAKDDARARGKFLEIMRDQARRMSRLVDDLLSLSRIEQKAHLRPENPVDLGLIVQHIVETLQPLAKDNGVDLWRHVETPAIMAGDHDELARVCENLVENSIKYGVWDQPGTDKVNRVEVRLVTQDLDAVLQIRDFGPGIAAEHLPRLTERFYRVDDGQSRAKGGTGLGLAIVKHIVARHRGRMQVESTLGEGTIFTLHFPLKQN